MPDEPGAEWTRALFHVVDDELFSTEAHIRSIIEMWVDTALAFGLTGLTRSIVAQLLAADDHVIAPSAHAAVDASPVHVVIARAASDAVVARAAADDIVPVPR